MENAILLEEKCGAGFPRRPRRASLAVGVDLPARAHLTRISHLIQLEKSLYGGRPSSAYASSSIALTFILEERILAVKLEAAGSCMGDRAPRP
jgi:hypothetical protein